MSRLRSLLASVINPAGTAERARLAAGLVSIRPQLEARGFRVTMDQGAGHGTFATATFRRGTLEIGLIVRFGDQLGCPNYSEGVGYVGHEDVMWALGYGGTERLIKSEGDGLSFRDRNGGDAFDALRADLERIILPALDASEDQFSASLARASRHLGEQRGW